MRSKDPTQEGTDSVTPLPLDERDLELMTDGQPLITYAERLRQLAHDRPLDIALPESPTVLERALVAASLVDDATRARQLESELDATVDPGRRACVAYTLGEHYEQRLRDSERATAAYRRALDADRSFAPAAWALRRSYYRAAAWSDLATLIDLELAVAADERQAELLFEQALVLGYAKRDGDARVALEAAHRLAPGHKGVLLELERLLARLGGQGALVDVAEQLAQTIEQPDRRTAYWLAVVRGCSASDSERARRALAAAIEIAPTGAPATIERVARVRVEFATAHGGDDELEAALGALTAALDHHQARVRDEVVALHRRRARVARASDRVRAWEHLHSALAIAPQDPVILADIVQLAAELGRDELVPFLASWRAAETEAGRGQMIAYWCAASHERPELRSLLTVLRPIAPGAFIVSAAIERDALLDTSRPSSMRALANAYLAAARGALAGTWLTPCPVQDPVPAAAATLFVQAAHVLAFYVPGAYEEALAALAHAREIAPDHPGLVETWIDVSEAADRSDEVLAVLRERDDGSRAHAERMIRLATAHDKTEARLDLERALVTRKPREPVPGWRFDASLARLGRNEERCGVLDRLAAEDPDRARTWTAHLLAARVHARTGAANASLDHYRALVRIDPDDAFARETWIDGLRCSGRWAEVADARHEEAMRTTDVVSACRALRETAWVLEVRTGDIARALTTYGEWIARQPDDRLALEGTARCAARLADHAREASARLRVEELDATAESRWLAARSLERAGRYDEAIATYRDVARSDHALVVTTAAFALVELASLKRDVALRVEALDTIARSTTDARLGASLKEAVAWVHMFAPDGVDEAATAFAAALTLDRDQLGASLGAVLTAARRSDMNALTDAYLALAKNVEGNKLAGALQLRVAALALAAGDAQRAKDHVAAAFAAVPDDTHVLVLAAELGPLQPEEGASDDPFVSVDRLLAHAEILARRAALADAPASLDWALDRADALEAAGQLREAAAALASVIETDPHNRRATVASRRIAHRVENRALWSQASFALAQLTSDREGALRLLREALEGASGPDAFAICSRIAELDAAAPEVDRVLAAYRERGDVARLVDALSKRLTAIAGNKERELQAIATLIERAELLRAANHHDAAIADLDAVLAAAPAHADALARHALLTAEVGDVLRALAMSWRYLATGALERRPDIEQLVERLQDKQRVSAITPTTPAAALTDVANAPSSTLTDVANDLFGGTTVRVDVTDLQAEERRIKRESDHPIIDTTTSARPLTVNSAVAYAVGAIDPRPVQPRALKVPALAVADLGIAAALPSAVVEPKLDLEAMRHLETKQPSEDTSAVVMLSLDQLKPTSNADTATNLEQLERELELTANGSASLRAEAGRLAESLGLLDRAREHYDAALVADPRAPGAMRGLRRLAIASGDIPEVIRLLEAELSGASARERDAMRHYAVDLMMATDEQDLARVQVGELLERSPSDLGALLAELELDFLDGRVEDISCVLDKIATTVGDAGLAETTSLVQATIAARAGDHSKARTCREQVTAMQPHSYAGSVAAIELAAVTGDTAARGAALFELACAVEGEDPATAAAAAMRALGWARGDTVNAAAQLAMRAEPRDPLVARLVAEVALDPVDPALAGHALSRWARSKAPLAERIYASARAAELDPERFGRLWAQLLESDPGDDYAAACLRAAHIKADHADEAIDLDVATGRAAPLLRAATLLTAQDRTPEAIDSLVRGHERDPRSVPIALALAEALAESGRWSESARVLGELAATGELVARDVMRLHCAQAWDAAADAAKESERRELTVAALEAWELVLDDDPGSGHANASAIKLARRLDDASILADVLAHAQAAERAPRAATSLALHRVRVLADVDPRLARDVAREAPDLDDPRRTLEIMLAAARCREPDEVATALEERARLLGEHSIEGATLLIRAAELALADGDAARAVARLEQAELVIPKAADELADVARRRAGRTVRAARTRADDSLTRVLRAAEDAAALDDAPAALAHYQHALELQSSSAYATGPVVALATKLGDSAAIAHVALEQLRTAEACGDTALAANAYELLSGSDRLRGDAASAVTALERAYRAAPTRCDLAQQLEVELAARARHADLLRLREHESEVHWYGGRDLCAFALDAAKLVVHAGGADARRQEFLRTALEADPRNQFALVQLDALLVSAGASEELVALAEHLAACTVDPRMRAACMTRAGETLAWLGRPLEAVGWFARASQIVPRYPPAFAAWREVALATQQWLSLADVVTRSAALVDVPEAVAGLHHFAGVVLSDKARSDQMAIAAFRRAIEVCPGHRDARVRLHQLEPGEHWL